MGWCVQEIFRSGLNKSSGTVIHPKNTPSDYDLEDGDKIDFSVFAPNSGSTRISLSNSHQKITDYFAVTSPSPALTEGDEGIQMVPSY